MSTTPQLTFDTFNFSYIVHSQYGNSVVFPANSVEINFTFDSVAGNVSGADFLMPTSIHNQAGIHSYTENGQYRGISKSCREPQSSVSFFPTFYSNGGMGPTYFTADSGPPGVSYGYPSDTYWDAPGCRDWSKATNLTFSFYKGTDLNTSQLVGVLSFPFGNNTTRQYLTLSDVIENDDENGTPFSSHGINCILKGTKILTTNGESNIEDLKRGDVILNSNGEEKIIKKVYYQKVEVDISNSDRDEYKDKYSLKEGNLVVSGGHMVKVDGEYHLPITSDKFENIQTENSENEYYHLELDEYDYFVANGVEVESLCNVQSQKDEYYKERGLEFQDLIKSKK